MIWLIGIGDIATLFMAGAATVLYQKVVAKNAD